MKNLAGVETCDVEIRKELEAAGIEVKQVEKTHSKVPFTLVGKLGNWTFRRDSDYWKATAPDGEGVPYDHAEAFNGDWRDQVRVVNYAGGADVHCWLSSSGTIDNYAVDTQEGLNAFADLVRKLAE